MEPLFLKPRRPLKYIRLFQLFQYPYCMELGSGSINQSKGGSKSNPKIYSFHMIVYQILRN